MELLDATIALAVTLAALATTVTVIMEIVVRVFGLKSKNQIELFKAIFDRSFKNRFKGNVSDFKFVTSILGNPLSTWSASAAPDDRNKPSGTNRSVLSKPTYRDVFGAKSLCVYDWVSTEHVFRHLLALPGVTDDRRSQLVCNLKEFNVEYNQLCAAAKTRFKTNLHTWSVLTGVMLALVLNINALRIFEAYMTNPALTAVMVAEMDDLIEQSEKAQAQLEAVLKDSDPGGLEKIDQRLELLQTQFGGLTGMGIPIGWDYSPHCNLGKSCTPEPGMLDGAATAPGAGGIIDALASIIASLITGLLIGLGAPFWFDLAKRLAQVRSMVKGKVGSEDTYDGETPISDTADYEDKTDKLITKLVDEAVASGKVVATRKLLATRREI